MSTPESSPRTDAEPLAFTKAEFLRGVLSAWLWFLGLSGLAQAFLLGPWVLLALVVTGPWSVVGVLIGAPLAYGLGHALRRVTAVPVHITLFAALGLLVGTATTAAAIAVAWGIPDSGFGDLRPFVVANVAAAGAAVGIGWTRTAFRALRDDRGRDAGVRRIDSDAALEDSL